MRFNVKSLGWFLFRRGTEEQIPRLVKALVAGENLAIVYECFMNAVSTILVDCGSYLMNSHSGRRKSQPL